MTKIETGFLSIGEFNDFYKDKTIYPYLNNRGGRRPDKKRIKNYAANWDTASSGAALLEKTGRGYMLRDFHNRAEAIKLGVATGKIDPKEQILVRVIPPGDGLTAYKNINSAKNHSSIDKLTNSDLAFGAEIIKILGKTRAFEMVEMPDKFYIQIARAVIDVKVKRRSDFAFSKNTSHEVNRYRDSPHEASEEIHLNEAQAQSIARAIDYYGIIRDIALKEATSKTRGTVSKTVERILGSAQLFGFVMFDHMFMRKLNHAPKVANAIVEHQRKVEDTVKALSHGGVEAMLESSAALISILNK